MMAADVALEKLRQQDQLLASENAMLKVDDAGLLVHSLLFYQMEFLVFST